MKKLRYERPITEILTVNTGSVMIQVSGEFDEGKDDKYPNITDGGEADDGMEAQSKGHWCSYRWDTEWE